MLCEGDGLACMPPPGPGMVPEVAMPPEAALALGTGSLAARHGTGLVGSVGHGRGAAAGQRTAKTGQAYPQQHAASRRARVRPGAAVRAGCDSAARSAVPRVFGSH